MKTIEYTFRDKSRWPRGPWDDEPDKVQWQDAATGLPCLVLRNYHGAWCGYVGVAEGHPLFGCKSGGSLKAHGDGPNFASFCDEDNREHGICHKPDPGEPEKVWWFGFDCSHAFDLVPRDAEFYREHDIHVPYRDLQYVKDQCADLAGQLARTVQ